MEQTMVTVQRLRALAWTAVLGVALVACQTAVRPPGFQPISFADKPPLNLDVGRVDVVRVYVPPGKSPNVEHEFPVDLMVSAERWARDRLRPVGVGGQARFIIKQASVVEVPLARSSGIRGALTTEQSERYDGVMEIEIEVIHNDGRRGMVASRTNRSRTVPENVSLQERETVWYQMTETMMRELDASLERQMREHLASLLR
jgi:hypothetical protein